MDLTSYLLGKKASGGGGHVITDYIDDTINFNTASNKNFSPLVKQLPKLKVTNDVTSLTYAFQGYQGEEVSFDSENSDFSNVANLSFMFYNNNHLKEVDMKGLTTTKVTTMYAMFENCTDLIKVDMSGISNTTTSNCSEAFYECNKLAVLDISSLNKPFTSVPSYYQTMFYNMGTECLQSDGAYQDGLPYVYVKDADMQSWILTQRTDWSTNNVVIKS